MYKKALTIYFLLILLQIVVIACCPSPKTIHYLVNDIRIYNTDLYTVITDSSSVSQSNFRIKCNIDTEELITNISNNSSLFIQTALATTCDDNYEGLKSDIVRFEIRCDKDILGTPSETPLNYDKIRIYKAGFTDDANNIRETVDEWLNILNNESYKLAFEWYFEFIEEINSDEFLKFELTFELEDGTIYQVETDAVKVE